MGIGKWRSRGRARARTRTRTAVEAIVIKSTSGKEETQAQKHPEEKTQAENRIGLLAEGLVISGLLYGGYLSIKGTHAYIKNNKEDLVDVLKDLRTKGKDVKEEFVNIIKNSL